MVVALLTKLNTAINVVATVGGLDAARSIANASSKVSSALIFANVRLARMESVILTQIMNTLFKTTKSC